MPASFATRAANSRLCTMNLMNASRGPSAGSTARSMKFLCRHAGSLPIFTTSSCSRSTIGSGVPAGANSPNHGGG